MEKMPNISGSTILVTGGSGLIGSHTIDQLIKEDIKRVIVFDKVINKRNLENARRSKKIKIIQGDIFNPEDVKKAVGGVDYVFHFAGMLLLSSAKDPRGCLRDNINGMFNLLEVLVKEKVKRLIYSSSVSIYGSSKKKVLMREEYPLNNRTMYGAGKIVGEQFCRVFHDMTGLNYLALRYSSVYGPRQHYEGLYPRLIMESLDRIEKGFSPQIEGQGEEVQDFIYVGDVVQANLLALKSDVNDEAINIASGRPTTVKELLQTLIGLTNPKLKIHFLPRSKKVFVPFRWFSIEKAKKLLRFKPETDLRTGLRQLIDWKKGL
jgi:UDP-glucose 4-epimerase